MTYNSPLLWINDDPKHTIENILTLDGNNHLLDVPGIGAFTSKQLNLEYNIFTINDLVGYVLYNGFPSILDNVTKFVISLRCADKLNYDLKNSTPM